VVVPVPVNSRFNFSLVPSIFLGCTYTRVHYSVLPLRFVINKN
jgi:hypothetical protein